MMLKSFILILCLCIASVTFAGVGIKVTVKNESKDEIDVPMITDQIQKVSLTGDLPGVDSFAVGTDSSKIIKLLPGKEVYLGRTEAPSSYYDYKIKMMIPLIGNITPCTLFVNATTNKAWKAGGIGPRFENINIEAMEWGTHNYPPYQCDSHGYTLERASTGDTLELTLYITR